MPRKYDEQLLEKLGFFPHLIYREEAYPYKKIEEGRTIWVDQEGHELNLADKSWYNRQKYKEKSKRRGKRQNLSYSKVCEEVAQNLGLSPKDIGEKLSQEYLIIKCYNFLLFKQKSYTMDELAELVKIALSILGDKLFIHLSMEELSSIIRMANEKRLEKLLWSLAQEKNILNAPNVENIK